MSSYRLECRYDPQPIRNQLSIRLRSGRAVVGGRVARFQAQGLRHRVARPGQGADPTQPGGHAVPGRRPRYMHAHVRPLPIPTGTRWSRSPVGGEGRAHHGCSAIRAEAAAWARAFHRLRAGTGACRRPAAVRRTLTSSPEKHSRRAPACRDAPEEGSPSDRAGNARCPTSGPVG